MSRVSSDPSATFEPVTELSASEAVTTPPLISSRGPIAFGAIRTESIELGAIFPVVTAASRSFPLETEPLASWRSFTEPRGVVRSDLTAFLLRSSW